VLDQGRIGEHHHPLDTTLAQLREGGLELGGHAGVDNLEFEAERVRRIHKLAKLDGDAGIVRIAHRTEAAHAGNDLPQ
jgi:hypothetical protein